MINQAQLLADVPELAGIIAANPSAAVYWLGIAQTMLNAAAWGPSALDPWPAVGDVTLRKSTYDFGVEMFVAHNLVLEAQAIKQGAAGGGTGLPGAAAGIKNSKSVDKVSIGYDTSTATDVGAGHWNLTVYGSRFIRLAKQIGSIPLQSGLPIGADQPLGYDSGYGGFGFSGPTGY